MEVDVLTQVLRTPFVLEQHMYFYVGIAFLVSQITYQITHWYGENYSVSYRALPFVEKKEWQSRIVSTIHAVIVFPICFYVVLTDEKYHADPTNGRNEWSDFAMALGVGYFLSDFLLVVGHSIPPILPIVCHHVFAGWGFLLAIGAHGTLRWYGCYLLLTEATTPFNNTHWALVRSGWKDHKVTKIIGYIWTVNWIIFRMGINPFLVYRVYMFWDHIINTGPYPSTVLLVNITFLLLLNNVYFFIGPFYELVFGEQKQKSEDTATQTKGDQISMKSHVKHRISNNSNHVVR